MPLCLLRRHQYYKLHLVIRGPLQTLYWGPRALSCASKLTPPGDYPKLGLHKWPPCVPQEYTGGSGAVAHCNQSDFIGYLERIISRQNVCSGHLLHFALVSHLPHCVLPVCTVG